MAKEFNAVEVKNRIVEWIRKWFEENGNGCNAVLGMSGGKDSTIVAALCVEAIGKERVIGVAMPDGEQGLNGADEICKYLGIKYICAPITAITTAIKPSKDAEWQMSNQAEQNVPPRARMMMLYAISQSMNGRVINTCNLSEDYVGYFTIFGDGAGDMSPLGNLTVTEILAVGDAMGLPREWVHKTPDDGLPHSSSDEQKFGFTYETLDKYIRDEEQPSKETRDKIWHMHKANLFKLNPMAKFEL